MKRSIPRLLLVSLLAALATPQQTYAQPAACLACDADQCAYEASACGTSQCTTIYACLLESQCALGAAPESCYCGNSPLAQCAQQAGATGPCATAIQTATGTTAALANLEAINNPTHPVGAAFERALCDRDLCLDGCTQPWEPAPVPSNGRAATLGLALLLLAAAMAAPLRRRAIERT